MALPGETILLGARGTCPDCGVTPVMNCYQSFAGWYVGTYCDCGPYSRETEYFATREEAEHELESIVSTGDGPHVRTTEYTG